MMKVSQLKGIQVPVVTPFLPNGELDLDSYRSYVRELLQQPIHGIIINGTTGESPTVSWEEVEELFRITQEEKRDRNIPLILGTGTNNTSSTVKRTELAGKLGADAVLVVTPYYNRPSQEGLLEHFRKVAETGMPTIVYDIPGRTGVALTLDTIKNLMDLDAVIGLKDCSGGLQHVSELSRIGSKPVLAGDDAMLLAMLAAGAAGGISASASLKTDRFCKVYELMSESRLAEAKSVFDELLPMIRLLFKESNPSPIKWMLAKEGQIASDTVRLPLMTISSSLQAELAGL
jgi:4-hydroxy-tetrahydrodipicolinate synthase